MKVASALISGGLDYCISLLYHTRKAHNGKLQRVRNAFSRTMCKPDKFSHMTLLQHKLHWLPIQYCILFKYNLLTYKAINLNPPPYLSPLIKWSDLTWCSHLSVSSTRLNKWGDVQFHSSCSHRMQQAPSSH